MTPTQCINNPPTSLTARRDAEQNGSLEHHRAKCLDFVRRLPGMTAREIQSQLGIAAHKRLPELRGERLVRSAEPRRCGITGRLAMTWWPDEPLFSGESA